MLGQAPLCLGADARERHTLQRVVELLGELLARGMPEKITVRNERLEQASMTPEKPFTTSGRTGWVGHGVAVVQQGNTLAPFAPSEPCF